MQCPSCSPCHSFHAQSPFNGSFFECRSVRISLIFGSCLDDSQSRTKRNPFSEHTRSRDDAVSFGMKYCHPTVLSVIASGVHHSQYELFSCVFLIASLSASRWSRWKMRAQDLLFEISWDNFSMQLSFFLSPNVVFRLLNLHLVQTLQYVVSKSVSDC